MTREVIVATLKRIQEVNPDQRLGQILDNATELGGNTLFYVADSDLLRDLLDYEKWLSDRRKPR